MGMYDTMKQMGTPAPNTPQPNAMGQGFAQQQPVQQMDAFKQKMQQRANPMMRARPAMSGGFNQQNSMSQTPNPMTGARPMMQQQPMGQSNSMMQQKQLMQKNQQAAQEGGAIGGSYNQLLSAHPELQQMRQTGAAAGQDMGWMDKPGALSMAPPVPDQEQGPQVGLQDVASRMGYGGSLNSAAVGTPDVMPRGIGPSDPVEQLQQMGNPMPQPMMQQVQMDENGLEPRRGAR